jgi:hypothetical protein
VIVNLTLSTNMKNCALIAARNVCSDKPFIVYSHTMGLLAEAPNFNEAKRFCDRQVADCRERAREPDAMLFQWQSGHWVLCAEPYDSHELSAAVPLSSL